MIHLINFLLKIIATILASIAGWCLIFIAIILWDANFMEYGGQIMQLIWEKNKNT